MYISETYIQIYTNSVINMFFVNVDVFDALNNTNLISRKLLQFIPENSKLQSFLRKISWGLVFQNSSNISHK